MPQPTLPGVYQPELVDLRKFPQDTSTNCIVQPNSTLTFGDMHGNAMKLIWLLLYHGIMQINEEDFTKLWTIYDKSFIAIKGYLELRIKVLWKQLTNDEIMEAVLLYNSTQKLLEEKNPDPSKVPAPLSTPLNSSRLSCSAVEKIIICSPILRKRLANLPLQNIAAKNVCAKFPEFCLTIEDLNEFCRILSAARFNSNSSIRLLGDIFADRGNNDWFTLEVIKNLDQKNVAIEFILSNHDISLFLDYYKNLQNNDGSNQDYWHHYFGIVNLSDIITSPRINESGLQDRSKVGLFTLLASGMVPQGQLIKIIEQIILPYLNLFSYSLSDNSREIILFMHAPNGLALINAIAQSLEVDYCAKNAKELAKTINAINIEFQSRIIMETYKRMYAFHHLLLALGITPTDDTILNKILAENVSKFCNNYVSIPKTFEEYFTVFTQNPFFYLVWCRNIEPPELTPNFISLVVHGHVGEQYTKYNGKFYNLDSRLGQTNQAPDVSRKSPLQLAPGTYKPYSLPERSSSCVEATAHNNLTIQNGFWHAPKLIPNEIINDTTDASSILADFITDKIEF